MPGTDKWSNLYSFSQLNSFQFHVAKISMYYGIMIILHVYLMETIECPPTQS